MVAPGNTTEPMSRPSATSVPPLAQALYQSAEVGQEIPAHLYRAVAEVLAYIYRLMGGRLS